MDEECTGDEICFHGLCMLSCASDEDCAPGVCRSELRAEQDDVVDVCVDAEPTNDVTMECRFDTDCDASFPGVDARCGIDGTCFIPAFSLLIRDTTVVDTSVEPLDGGLGADIAAIYIEDPQTHEPIAWADTLTLEPANDVTAINPPDGRRVSLDAMGQCSAAPFETAAAPLGGEGGTLLVRFLEGVTGDTVSTPPSTWNVVVVEWGENCPGGELGEPDSYSVFACAATSHKSTDPDRDCGELLATAPTGGRILIEAVQK